VHGFVIRGWSAKKTEKSSRKPLQTTIRSVYGISMVRKETTQATETEKGDTMSTQWEIRTLNAGPSMSETIETFDGTYNEACAVARARHAAHGRRVSVVRGMYYWFTIREGEEIDKNRRAA